MLLTLAALKCDLREESRVIEKLAHRSLHPVTYDEGLSVARSIRAARYLGKYPYGWTFGSAEPAECSAKHNRGVQEAIYEAAKVSVGTRPKGGANGIGGLGTDDIKSCSCTIM